MALIRPRFPQEVADMVVDHVGDDSPTLAALGLVSRQWYRRTRQGIFHEITISEERPESRFERLKILFQQTPYLRQFTKKLKLLVYSKTYIWLYAECPHFLQLLLLLTSLETFCLEGPPSLPRWDLMPLTVQIGLYDFMARPHVQTILLAQIAFIDLIPIAQYHHLKYLVLCGMRVPPFEALGACFPLNAPRGLPAGLKKQHLQIFGAHTCGTALRTLVECAKNSEATSDLFQPVELELNTDGFVLTEMEAGWNALLGQCAANTETYIVTHDATPPSPDDWDIPKCYFPLRKMPKLSCLTLFVSSHCLEWVEDPFPVLIEELDLLSKRPSRLAQLNVNVDFATFKRQLRDVEDDMSVTNHVTAVADHEIWSRLEDILARDTFPLLKEVTLFLDATGFLSKTACEGAKKRILAQMPVLHARKIVELVPVL